MSDELYIETLLEEARNPQNLGSMPDADLRGSSANASCGDEVHIDLKLDADGRIFEIAWSGKGCVISQAAMSVLSEEIKGKTVEEIRDIGEKEMLELLGLEEIVMGRKKCLMLGVKAIQKTTKNN